ncbi:acyl-CoA thioester hydrolase/BAAT C-terminal domain-containing protein [Sporosarcina sp. D27]
MSHFGKEMTLLLGGNIKDYSQAQFEAWHKVKVFFNKYLSTSSD